MTPEQKAREAIDQRLAQAGWILQDMHQLNPMAGPGVAVLEFPTSTGPVRVQVTVATAQRRARVSSHQ